MVPAIASLRLASSIMPSTRRHFLPSHGLRFLSVLSPKQAPSSWTSELKDKPVSLSLALTCSKTSRGDVSAVLRHFSAWEGSRIWRFWLPNIFNQGSVAKTRPGQHETFVNYHVFEKRSRAQKIGDGFWISTGAVGTLLALELTPCSSLLTQPHPPCPGRHAYRIPPTEK